MADLSMRGLKHCFTNDVKHWFIPNANARSDNQGMLDDDKEVFGGSELAARIRYAMDEHDPPVKQSALAAECGVTPQAVHGWRKTGRIHKRHLQVLARLTAQPLRYFVGDDVDQSMEAQARRLADDWLTLTPRLKSLVRETLDDALAKLTRYPELRADEAAVAGEQKPRAFAKREPIAPIPQRKSTSRRKRA